MICLTLKGLAEVRVHRGSWDGRNALELSWRGDVERLDSVVKGHDRHHEEASGGDGGDDHDYDYDNLEIKNVLDIMDMSTQTNIFIYLSICYCW